MPAEYISTDLRATTQGDWYAAVLLEDGFFFLSRLE